MKDGQAARARPLNKLHVVGDDLISTDSELGFLGRLVVIFQPSDERSGHAAASSSSSHIPAAAQTRTIRPSGQARDATAQARVRKAFLAGAW